MQTADNAGVVVDPVDPVDPDLIVDPVDPDDTQVDPVDPVDPAEDDGEIEITLGNVAAPATEEDDASAPEWVRNLRKENRELSRKLKDLEKSTPAAEPQKPTVGPRPTLADHDYDEDAYNAALDKWIDAKRAADDHEAAQQRKADEAKQEQQRVLDGYRNASAKLRVPDFKAAEETVAASLSEAQQGIILNGADDPAKLVYVLGKYPEELKKLASIANPVKFAFAVAKLEREVKVTTRTAKPSPETTMVTGSASKTGSDAKLEQLRKRAAETGNADELIAYQRKLRAQQKAKR